MSDTYQLTIALPKDVQRELPNAETRVKQLLAMDLYKKGGCSMGWAAMVAGMSLLDFEFLL
jgi:predicted HTH domain antitoxin